MGNSEKFSSIDDLYKRVLPALQAKVTELKREKLLGIDTMDIWNYCIENTWKNKKDLRMFELVDDILNVEGINIAIYTKKNIYRKIDRDDLI